jgi:hypothetical protein
VTLIVEVRTPTSRAARGCAVCRARVRPHRAGAAYIAGTDELLYDDCGHAHGAGRPLWLARHDSPITERDLTRARQHAREHPRLAALDLETLARIARTTEA